MADFPPVVFLGELAPSEGFSIRGDRPGDMTSPVASAGDFNGDGIPDILFGAAGADDGGTSSGRAYVIFGRADGLGNIDLSQLSPSDGVILRGEAAYDSAGAPVASAGDIDGDGYDDIVVGARGNDDGGDRAGKAYVVFGGPDPSDEIDLGTLTAAQGFSIRGVAGSLAGTVASAGDVNRDGYGDIIIGAHVANDSDGEVYVLFGKAGGFADVDLGNLGPAQGFVIRGRPVGSAGAAVSSAGDFNGDGFADVIIGEPFSRSALGTEHGAAYVLFGKDGGFSDIDLSLVPPTDGFRLEGKFNSEFGETVASAGDINGDGYDDILIGAGNAEGDGDFAGEVYVIFGRPEGFESIDIADLDISAGFTIRGATRGDLGQVRVAPAGDINGDGFADIAIGAGGDNDQARGKTYILFGRQVWDGDVRLANLAPADGFVLQGDIGERAGWDVASVADLDGDGFGDVAIGAPYSDVGGADSGQVYVVYGRAPTAAVVRTGTGIGQTIRGGAFDDVLSGLGGDDTLIGNGGDDVLLGGAGADALSGGEGRDTASYADASAGVVVRLAAAAAQDTGGAGIDTLDAIENLTGSAFADVLEGDGAANSLAGEGGDDQIAGSSGDDSLRGGAGRDVLSGDAGRDIAIGDAGDDVVSGGADADQLHGGSGDDDLFGGFGNDSLIGGSGADFIVGDGGDDLIDGGAGDDLLHGGSNDDRIFGRAGQDVLAGGAGNDILDGGSERDHLIAGSGDDSLFGGEDADTLNGGEGADRFDGGPGADRLYADAGADIFAFGSLADAGDRIFGFRSGLHALEVDASGFGGLAGDFAFVAANGIPMPTTAQQTFLYDLDDGKLFFDPDGTGPSHRLYVGRLLAPDYASPALLQADDIHLL